MIWKKENDVLDPEKEIKSVDIKPTQTFTTTPENQFAHAAGLLAAQGHGIDRTSDISELLNQACFLGLQNSDQFIRFWQVDAMFITNLFTMAQKSKSDALMQVFNLLYTNFKFEIRLTGNKDGLERKLQHSFGGGGMNAAEIGRLMERYKDMQGQNYGPEEKKGLFS
jgi:hypothetical protein